MNKVSVYLRLCNFRVKLNCRGSNGRFYSQESLDSFSDSIKYWILVVEYFSFLVQ